jgi:flavoprotein
MYNFYTSADVLNIVLAAAIGLVAIMIAWVLYYVAMMLRDSYHIVRDLKEITGETKKAVYLFKEKAMAGTYLLSVISKGVKDVAKFVDEKMGEGKKGKVKNKK